MEIVMTLVIMAAGMGSRYGGLKQIDPITKNGEFIVDFSIYDAVLAGFDKVVFIIKEENYDIFRETVGARIEGKVNIEYVFQKPDSIPSGFEIPEGRVKPWGTAHAVLSARDAVNEPFAVINSDDFYGRDAFAQLYSCMDGAKTSGHFAMAGYILENTITENGTVSRGVCSVENGFLVNVTERTQIKEIDGVIKYFENDTWHELARDSVVSMNCWAFTPDIFDSLEEGFVKFFEKLPLTPDPKKAEYLLPTLVQSEIDGGKCDVRVLKTSAKWHGITYAEDKPEFVKFINSEIEKGVYPDGLWK